MASDNEQFESVSRLLALKRHEQPPPGYFDQFPNRVLARIRVGDKGADADWVENLFGEAPWVRQLWSFLETKPAFTGALGAIVSALLVGALIFSEKPDLALANSNHSGLSIAAAMADDSASPAGLVAAHENDFQFGSTNGVFASSRQDSFFGVSPQTVSFAAPAEK